VKTRVLHGPTCVDSSLATFGPYARCQNKRKRESLLEFIQRSCNKRSIISEVNGKSIIRFFKKGLCDSSLIRKVTMKNFRTSEEMLAIANKQAQAKEVPFDTREQKKDKELGHSD
jgi:hypothetical protein